MLQGTLDVFSLDEVLGLLSGANKNGVLNITGDRGVGTVSISDGHLVAGSASSAPGAAALSDVVFELLRYEEGSFSFDGASAVEGEPHELEAIMTEAHSRLDEWKGIEAVVPSLDHHVSLSATLSTSQVTLSESEWAAVVAIGEGAPAGVVARRLGLGEFDGSKRIKSLIERSLASLEEGAATAEPTVAASITAEPATAEPTDATEAPTPVVEEPVASAGPVFETPEPAPASFAEVSAPVADAPVDAEPLEHAVAEIAPDISLETVAPDAPAFEDSAVEAFAAQTEIPPMPEAPSFDSVETESFDSEVPPMPEPPSRFTAAASDSVPPPPAPPFVSEVFDAPAADVSPASFGGLDPIGGPDMFEAPLRGGERSTDVFGGEGFDASVATTASEIEAPLPPPPAPVATSADWDAADEGHAPFTPPSGFDAFDAGDDHAVDGAEAADSDEEPAAEAKGGSLLMRYLKSNG